MIIIQEWNYNQPEINKKIKKKKNNKKNLIIKVK